MVKKNKKIFFRKIGFYDPVKIQLKEAAKPLGNRHNWGEIETMTIGFGHGFGVTSLHLASAYCTMLNQGMKSNPKILLEKKSNEKVDQIISKNTSKHILKLLRAVIQETEFTGPKVNIEGYDIGG